MKILVRILGLVWISHTVHAGLIYGVDQIQNNYRRVSYPAYVQMGSFSTMGAAQRLQQQMQANILVPAGIKSSGGLYKVIMGPFPDQQALKAFARKGANGKRQLLKRRQSTSHSARVMIPASMPVPVLVSKEPVPASTFAERHGLRPELSVFLGGSYIPNTIKGQTLQLLPYEIGPNADTFINQSSASAFTFGAGALYRFNLAPSLQNRFFDSIGAGLDFFQITNFNQTGSVLQFGMPEFENYTYALKLNNSRIMADFDLNFHPIRSSLIPFIEAGIGGAKTEVSYNSVPLSPVESPNFTLPNEAGWRFAYQAGAGVKYVAARHLALSLRYLYANMGKVNSSIQGSSTTLATPLTVTMSTQNFLFGLTYLVV